MSEKENYEVITSTEIPETDTTIITTSEMAAQWLENAMRNYDPTNRQYSAYLSDKTTSGTVTPEVLDELSNNPQNDLNKVKRINAIIKKFINSDDIIGKADEAIDTNLNTDYKLSYREPKSGRNITKKFDEAKEFINDFNELINVEQLIHNSVSTTYREGNYVMYLRHDNGDYIVDFFPLGVVEVSNYEVGGNPYLLINMNELQSRLSNNYPKTKKRKPLFFENIAEEIKETYPEEVYQAYINKEQYAKLDIRYSAIIRINNMNGKYGVSSILRALPSTLLLKQFQKTDGVTSKVNSRRIIVQTMNKEFAGQDYNKDCFDLQAYNHNNIVQAFKADTVLVTTNPSVKEVYFVESKVELTKPEIVTSYRSTALNALGIGFLSDASGSQSVSSASINVSQLMKTINKISEQLENVLYKWYKQILIDNGYDMSFAPKIDIIDSEQMEQELKNSLATLLFSTMNCSYETALGVVGVSIEDEVQKRKRENSLGYDEIFKPHGSQYTNSGKESNDNTGGRPSDSDNESKQGYDKERQKKL